MTTGRHPAAVTALKTAHTVIFAGELSAILLARRVRSRRWRGPDRGARGGGRRRRGRRVPRERRGLSHHAVDRTPGFRSWLRLRHLPARCPGSNHSRLVHRVVGESPVCSTPARCRCSGAGRSVMRTTRGEQRYARQEGVQGELPYDWPHEAFRSHRGHCDPGPRRVRIGCAVGQHWFRGATAPSTAASSAASTAPSAAAAAGQTDTEWGRIWDTLPSRFPRSPARGRPRRQPTGPASATLVIDGDVSRQVAAALVTLLAGAGFPTGGLGTPLGERRIRPRGDGADGRLQGPGDGRADGRRDARDDPVRGRLPARLNRGARRTPDLLPPRNARARLCVYPAANPAGNPGNQPWGRRLMQTAHPRDIGALALVVACSSSSSCSA